MRPVLSACLVAGVLGLLIGCGSERPIPKSNGPQYGFHPEELPDIPLPRLFQMDVTHDQLAMVMAGGAIRRFDVDLIQRENASPQSGSDLLAWYRRELTNTGWTLADESARAQHWTKGQESLRLETGRSDGRTTISFRLRPNLPQPAAR